VKTLANLRKTISIVMISMRKDTKNTTEKKSIMLT